MKYSNIVIYCDYDGTLTSNGQYAKENLPAIDSFVKQGGRFAIASGKAMSDIDNMPTMSFNAPMICLNGAAVHDFDKGYYIYQHVMGKEAAQIAKEIYVTLPEMGLNSHLIDDTVHSFHSNPILSLENAYWFHGLEPYDAIDKIVGKAIMISAFGEYSDTDKVRELVASKYPTLTCTMSYPQFLNIMIKGTSKGNALVYLKKEYYKNNEIILAVGDSENDLEMLQIADVSFAVGNATDEIKKVSDIVLEDSHIACIPQILEYIDNHLLKGH